MTTAQQEQDELIADFVDEALASLVDLPARLDAHRRSPEDPDAINAVFRAIHSMKGCAGFLSLTAIKAFAHALENSLDEVRNGRLTLTEELQRTFIQGFDHLDGMLRAAAEGVTTDDLAEAEHVILAEVSRQSTTSVASEEDSALDALGHFLAQLADEIAAAGVPRAANWSARLRAAIARPSADAATHAEVPALRTPDEYLIARCVVDGEDLSLAIATVARSFLDYSGGREPVAGETLCGAISVLVDWATAHERESIANPLTKARSLLDDLRQSPLDINEVTLRPVWESLAPGLTALEHLSAAPQPPAQIDEIHSEPAVVETHEASPRTAAEPAAAAHHAKARYVRVKEERLDEFLGQVSRLFITGELLKDLCARMAQTKQLVPLVEEMRQVNRSLAVQSTQLQLNVVSLRRVAISGLFSKFPRMARELAEQLGKKIDVHLGGEEVEIDKALVEDLDAPLTHMIRNVIDHALESPDERATAGKSPVGELLLHAELTRSHVRIHIADDGRGIDPVKLRRKAVEKGVITQSQADAQSDQQAIELIFHAGFSTAEKVSEISGRGVGMDVVRTAIRDRGGDIVMESVIGRGTKFTLSIPIRTGALVIDGLMVRHAEQDFVIPFDNVREITELSADDLKPVQGSRVATIRGKTYDALCLSRVLDLPETPREAGEGRPAVIVGAKHVAACFLVDHVAGHRQVVVNSLQEVMPGYEKIAGVAQLGGGRLALVLSVPDILKQLAVV